MKSSINSDASRRTISRWLRSSRLSFKVERCEKWRNEFRRIAQSGKALTTTEKMLTAPKSQPGICNQLENHGVCSYGGEGAYQHAPADKGPPAGGGGGRKPSSEGKGRGRDGNKTPPGTPKASPKNTPKNSPRQARSPDRDNSPKGGRKGRGKSRNGRSTFPKACQPASTNAFVAARTGTSPSKEENAKACRNYIKGICKFGKDCEYLHIPHCKFHKDGKCIDVSANLVLHQRWTPLLRKPQKRKPRLKLKGVTRLMAESSWTGNHPSLCAETHGIHLALRSRVGAKKHEYGFTCCTCEIEAWGGFIEKRR